MVPGMSTLKDKVAIVTGASRGIGAAIAKRLAKEGAAVAITYSASPARADEVVKEITSAGGKAIAIQADSADPAAIKATVEKTVATFGGLHILVNNAGVGLMGPITEFSLEDLDRTINVNIKGVYVFAQEAARHMGEGGRIINIGSCMSDRTPFPGASAYTMSKAAVAGFTRALGTELAPKGITVNNVQPGPIDTEMNPADGPNADFMKSIVPAKRFGHTDEIAAMVAFLAGPDAGFIIGTGIVIDGGYAA